MEKPNEPLLRKAKVAWCNMKTRCYSRRYGGYKNYGGRGIRVLYAGFTEFIADVGLPPSLGHTLDRIDNDRYYEPGNCRWATHLEQHQKQRSVVLLTHNGRTMTQREWARFLKIDETTLSGRRAAGWPIEKVLSRGFARKTKVPCGCRGGKQFA